MTSWWAVAAIIGSMTFGLVKGCDVGWDFLKEGGGGGNRTATAQVGCQSGRVVLGQFPPSGGLFANGAFTADYSSPTFNGPISTKALGLRVSRNRLWLNDLSIEVSFFPADDTTRDPRNACLGRALLEINIPAEDLFLDNTPIDILSTRASQTEPSAFYAEGGDPGFTASAVKATIRLLSADESTITADFELVFNPGMGQRVFTNGKIDDTIDQNPAAEGL